MNVTEKRNLVTSVVDDIIEAASEKDYCDSEGQGENFNRHNIEDWVWSHLEDLDLEETNPEDWAETFITSYHNTLVESVQKPVSDLDKLEGIPFFRKEEKSSRQENVLANYILNEATECMGVPILNLKRPVKATPDAEILYEYAVRCGSSYKGFESVADAEKFIKRNYLLLMWRD